jgi:hypothetical protein
MVKFNSAQEFLKELEKDKDKVERRIVRLVYQWTPSKLSPNIQHLSVVATARVEGEVYRLDRYCGDVWQIDGQDEPVKKKAEETSKVLGEGCAALGLEVRSGCFEP